MVAVVVHTEVGSEAGTAAEFQNPASQVSAHFSVGLDGRATQYVQLTDSAWANGILEPGNAWEPVFGAGNPNNRTISIETEDDGQPDSQPVTDEQYASVLAVARLGLAQWPSITHLASHHAISPQSRTCPARRWLDSGRFDRLAADLGLTPLK